MDENRPDNLIDAQDFSLESILAEYEAEELRSSSVPQSESKDMARQIMMEALSSTIVAGRVASGDPDFGVELKADAERVTEAAVEEAEAELASEPDDEATPEEEREPERPKPLFQFIDLRDGGSYEEYARAEAAAQAVPDDEPEAEAEPEPEPEPEVGYAEPATAYPQPPEERVPFWGESGPPKSGAFEAVMAPVVSLLAMAELRRQKREAERDGLPEGDEREVPEVSPAKAGKHYGKQAVSLRMRGRMAFFLCVFLVIISYFNTLGWWLPGALAGTRTASLVCLILLLAIMVIGLDVFTAGVTSLIRGAPGAETLVSLSCVFAALDAVMVAAGRSDAGLPYCAASGLSMACALLGARLTCSGLAAGFRTAAATKKPGVVTVEKSVIGGDDALLKTEEAELAGFVRRSEEPDAAESCYRTIAPFLIAAALILAAFAALSKDAPFLHTLSALLAVSAPFSALLSFPLPFALTAASLRRSGAAVAGWSGCEDMGRSRRVIVTDTDLFPAGNVTIAGVNILEGTFTGKAVSCTGSLLAASGSGLAAPFVERIRDDGYAMLPVEELEIMEGGGLSAMIRGERVLVGSSGFMNLMGIRLPHSLVSKSAVFTAVDGTLVAVFNMNYTPLGSVQDALVSLLHGSCEPLFAVRDFNITPVMVRQKFKMPTERFDFPSYEERFRVSSAKRGEDSQISAVLSRPGLLPTVEAADRGRRLFRSTRASLVFSVAASVIGMILMFFILRSGAMDSASAGNMLTFMLLWLVPLALAAVNVAR